jgi:hypothetical protein
VLLAQGVEGLLGPEGRGEALGDGPRERVAATGAVVVSIRGMASGGVTDDVDGGRGRSRGRHVSAFAATALRGQHQNRVLLGMETPFPRSWRRGASPGGGRLRPVLATAPFSDQEWGGSVWEPHREETPLFGGCFGEIVWWRW